jgi:hypothetical protein
VLDASSSPNRFSYCCLEPRQIESCADLLTLVNPLLQPSLDGFAAVSHVPAHPIADWTIAPVPPAIQGVNRDA